MTSINAPRVTLAPGLRPPGRGDVRTPHSRTVIRPSLRMLRMPLLGKLVGANVLVGLAAVAAMLAIHRGRPDDHQLLAVAIAGLALCVVASTVLMKIALQPLGRLRSTLHNFERGEVGVRIHPSAVADADLLRVGDAVNELLDDLVAERARLHQLARDTIRSADEERARIARGLHDSTAQTLAALSLEARMATQLHAGTELTQQLELIKDLAVDALEEVRELSHTIHPRVLDDLGIAAALGWLGRCVQESSGLEPSLRLTGDTTRIPVEVASALFRVAEAALHDASGHGAHAAEVHLAVGGGFVELVVRDDGTTAQRPASRLHELRKRLALAAGTLTITDNEPRGAQVHAVVPLGGDNGQEARSEP